MIRIFTLLAFTFLTIGKGFSQNHVNYSDDSRWFIGFNLGGAWTTQTEVANRIGAGYELILGRSYGMKQDRMFSLDTRYHLFNAQFRGQSEDQYHLNSASISDLSHLGPKIETYKDSLGYFIPNFRTNLLGIGVDGVLNTNLLRQKTGWNLSVFGGIGIYGYRTKVDLYQDDIFLDEPIYDYNQLNNSSQTSILSFQDNDYETKVRPGSGFSSIVLKWMPSAGFGISKQVHPFVAIGLEHKMTWTRSNLFDGMSNKTDGSISNVNDVNHFTSLYFKFHLPEPDPNRPRPPKDEANVDPVSRNLPIIKIYSPSSNPFTTNLGYFNIKANIYHVTAKSNITFKQNGNVITNFTFNAVTSQFESNVALHSGHNLFEITGRNESGSDHKSVIIVYEKEEEPISPPIVNIANPTYSPYTTNSNVFRLVSTVLNVDSKSQIRVYLNGISQDYFSYNNATKVVNVTLNLKEGFNTLTINGTNTAGSDSKIVEFIYEKPVQEQLPIVEFTVPSSSPFYVSVPTLIIQAIALNVTTKANLNIKLNGAPIPNFSFNTISSEIYFNIELIEGTNIVEISGINNVGMGSELMTIIYSRLEAPKPPIVNFTDPDTNPTVVYEDSYGIVANIKNVSSKTNIILKINGMISTLFTYNPSSGLMNFTTGLVEGSNTIEIKGLNIHGEDTETRTIIYEPQAEQKPPLVKFIYPIFDNVEFGSPELALTARVLYVSDKENIDVLVNGVPTTNFTYNIYTSVLNLSLILVEGTNVVQITGTNLEGTDSKTRIVKYKEPMVIDPPRVSNPPTVRIDPLTSPHLVEACTLIANTTYIDSKSQITLKHNGNLISGALYTLTAEYQIIYNATLTSGSNVFEVRVENVDGSASEVTVIMYEKDEEPCIIPTVGYISPVPYSTVENADITIDAQINNHSAETTVELKLNGSSLGYMTYNAETSIASKAITLIKGSNAINVVVTNDCGTNQATFTLVYNTEYMPCTDPTLIASGSTTFSTLEEEVSINLTANDVANASELTVKLNSTEIPIAFDSGTGNATITGIDLSIGVNTLTISAKTDCGAAVLTYVITREECKTPIISSISPINGSTTEAESIVLTSTIMNVVTEEIIVLLNGVSQVFSFNAETHKLSEALPLAEGSNTIEIRAKNVCGSDVKTVNITREIPCETIVTNLLSPSVSPIVSTEETYTIMLHANGLTSVEQISVTLNEEAVTPTLDIVSGNVRLPSLTLIDGDNSIVITLINECSESVVSYVVTYNGCETPVVVINGIVPGMTVTKGVFSLSALITNVSDASDIILKVNGDLTYFDFNQITHLLTAEIPLVEGLNIIDIIANGCEKVSGTASVVFEKPCEQITHTLMTPNTTLKASIQNEFEITLSTFAVESAEQITVTLNAVVFPFEFNVKTGIITISGIDLIEGTNTVIVGMTNDCSSDTVTYTVDHNPCETVPVITVNGLADGMAFEETGLTLYANISHVDHASGIIFMFNGISIPFEYDPTSDLLQVALTLMDGSNSIEIIVNGCSMVTEGLHLVH